MRSDTHRRSLRMSMFRQMAAAGFEVHVRTTTGLQEKCIDIQLAVEMMHFASVPGAYGGAVLELTSCTAAPNERRRTSCLDG